MKRYRSLFEAEGDKKSIIQNKIKKAELEITQQKINLKTIDPKSDTANEKKQSINDRIKQQQEIIKKLDDQLSNMKKEEK